MYRHIACSALLLFGVSGMAAAQDFPQRPVRLLVGFVPGGGADRAARFVAQKLSEAWKQPVIVDNRAGADGNVATEIVAKSAPDGYTLLVSSPGPVVTNRYLYSNLPYDPEKDLAPITLIATTASVFAAHPATPFNNIKELVVWARAKPRALNYGSSGVGSMPHLSMELFRSAVQVEMVHVPYKSTAPSVIDLIGGRVELTMVGITTMLPQLKAQKAKALAVTSLKRSAVLPDVPTIDESGVPGYDSGTWWGLLAPAGIPPGLVSRINQIVARSINSSEIKESLAREGTDAVGNTPAEFGVFLRKETAKWAKIIKTSGIKVE